MSLLAILKKLLFLNIIKEDVHIIFLSVAGEFIPKSYYIIDQNGHKSDVIELRNRRDLLPILRARRSNTGNTGSTGGGNPYNPGSASGNIVFGNIPNFATPGRMKNIIKTRM